MKTYELHFSNSNNVWYNTESFNGTEIEMLDYANKKLHNKEKKLYHLWIYDEKHNIMYMDYTLAGCFHRGKKLEKLIQTKLINTEK
jgi:hypothetical protein